MDTPPLRPDLYVGTATYYDEFRLPYPASLVADLFARAGVTGAGRLLDLACGPGTLTFALAPRFAEVWAVDLEPEAIDLAVSKAQALGVGNVRWMKGRAEDVDPHQTFDMVTVGTAFHRLDRRRVAELATGWLPAGAHIALLWSSTPLNGDADWCPVLAAAVFEWMERLGLEDRMPARLQQHVEELPHVDVLTDAGFVRAVRHEVTEVHHWTVAELIGWVHSTALLPRHLLGDQAAEFDADISARLLTLEPSGVLREHVSFAYDLARASGRRGRSTSRR